MGRFGIGGKRNTSRFLPSSVVQYYISCARAVLEMGGTKRKTGG